MQIRSLSLKSRRRQVPPEPEEHVEEGRPERPDVCRACFVHAVRAADAVGADRAADDSLGRDAVDDLVPLPGWELLVEVAREVAAPAGRLDLRRRESQAKSRLRDMIGTGETRDGEREYGRGERQREAGAMKRDEAADCSLRGDAP